MSNLDNIPIGIRLTRFISARLCPRVSFNRIFLCKTMILILSYAAYTCYHMTRKSLSVVKAVLHKNCSGISDESQCGYAPFDGPDSSALLGALDSAFLFSYGIAMFMSGIIAERVSLRYFLSTGMILSGIFCYLFGMGKVYNIHSLSYFLLVQALAGIFQTTGWPGVVTLVGRWFGKTKRGLIFGIWNSHTSIGNILGIIIAAKYVETDWSMSFIVPGFIMGVVGFILFLFVLDSPEQISQRYDPSRYRTVSVDSETEGSCNTLASEETPILAASQHQQQHHRVHKAIGFFEAISIPGVVEFSISLFFAKLVSYTFLFWLPLYIESSTSLGAALSADLSIVFDVGGIFGAIAAGISSDLTGMNALTCAVMLFISAPLLLVYQGIGSSSLALNVLLLFVSGVFVNGPYALITTTVSAELGQHSTLDGNSKALATVTSIIDGSGSIGAAVGPLIAGLVVNSGWSNVFYVLIASNIIALLSLSRLVFKECIFIRRRNGRIE